MSYVNIRFKKNESLKLVEIVSLIAEKTNSQPKIYGRGYCLRCPAHNDKNPSLSVSESNDGIILMYCFAGCSTEDIRKVTGLSWKDLFPKRKWR